jgi:hypothetical protein
MRSVTYSMSVSLHWLHRWAGRRLRLDGARRGGLWLLDRQVPIGRRPPAGTTAVQTMLYWETAAPDQTLDDQSSSGPRSGSRCQRSCSPSRCGGARQCPPGLRRPGGGDRALASRAAGGDIAIGGASSPARRPRRVWSTIPGHGLPGAGRWWRSVLSPTRAPGESRTRRDAHPNLHLECRLPPPPRGALAASTICGEPSTKP